MSTLTLQVNNQLSVNILPSQEHEFIMTSKEVAIGYGVSFSSIREHLRKNKDELVEGKHWLKGVSFSDTLPSDKGGTNCPTLAGTNLQPHQTFWTKRGIVRLGFFIKSERAKQFRDWAEDLIIYAAETNVFKRIEELEKKINQLQQPAITTQRQLLPTNQRPSSTVLQQIVSTDAVEVEMIRQSGLFTPSEIYQIARAAGWLRMLANIDVRKARTMGYSSIEIFRRQVLKCIINEQNATPEPLVRFKKGTISNQRILYVNAVKYRKQGISALIHAGFGNQNRKRKALINYATNTTLS